MNVNLFTKKAAAAVSPKSVKGASPVNEIGDVSAVAAMFARLRQQNAQYDQAIAALVAANRITCGWDKPAEPEMTLTIQREVLVAQAIRMHWRNSIRNTNRHWRRNKPRG